MQNKILYFHGLDSFLSDDKKIILEKYGIVEAPVTNYREFNIYQFLDPLLKTDATVVTGSSFGGYIGYTLAQQVNLPCLLFNPALIGRSINAEYVKGNEPAIMTSLSYIVLGKKDEVINCAENFDYISKNVKGPKKIIIEETLAHRIPLDIFEKHVAKFFQILNMQKLPES